MKHHAAWILGLLVGVGCSSGRDAPPSSGPAAAEPVAPTGSLAQLQTVPELRSMIAAATPFAALGDGFAAWPRYADGVAARVGGGRVRLQAGREPSAFVEIDGLGEDWSLVEGTLRRSEREVDSWLLSGADRFEEVRVLASAGASHRFDYRLTMGPDYHSIRVEDGAVIVSGAPGTPALVASRAWARDARGKRRWLTAELQASGRQATLRYALDPTDMTYPIVVDPSWSTSSSLIVARGNHGQVRLSGGRVLVVGGQDVTTIYSSAEILEVGKATVSAGAMATKRAWPIAVTLPSGKVLVAGGATTNSYGDAVSTAEIFDPAGAGSWAGAAPMTVPRANARAVLLPSGKVLVVGGSNSSTGAGLSTVEIYDPTVGAAGSWSATGSMTTARTAFALGLLPSGKVVAAGGRPSSGATASAEIWDPASSGWSSAGTMLDTRFFPCSTVLSDGRLLVAGGYDSAGTAYLKSTSLFDGSTWLAGPTMGVAREACTATTLLDGTAMIAGGFDGAARTATTSLFAGGAISAGPSMITPRSEHGATLLLEGRVLVAGGLTAGNAGLNSAWSSGGDCIALL